MSGYAGIKLQNPRGVWIQLPENSNFLFKDLLWDHVGMRKLWKRREVFTKFSIEEFEN